MSPSSETETICSIHPSDNRDQKQNSRLILFVARRNGPAKCLAPVGRQMADKGTDVYFATKFVATERIIENFPKRQELGTVPGNISTVVISGDDPINFEVESVSRVKQNNPESKIAIVEDFPGSIASMIDGILRSGFTPDLVLTTTRTQADRYRQDYKNLPKVIPIGQPDFDGLLKEDFGKIGKIAREKLQIGSSDVVIAYIGTQADDHPHVTNKFEELNDLNSVTLLAIKKSITEIAKRHPEKKFVLINKPHPGEPRLNLWKHPVLEDINEKAGNLRVISQTKNEWQLSGLTTRQVCAASSLTPMLVSTVGEEVALADSRLADADISTMPIPMNILLDEYVPGAGLPEDGIKIARLGFSALCEKEGNLTNDMERALFGESLRAEIHNKQRQILKNEYRFKAEASRRASSWISFLDRH